MRSANKIKKNKGVKFWEFWFAFEKLTGLKFNVSKTTWPFAGHVVFNRVQAISPAPTSAHWLMSSASLPYRNHDKYESHLKNAGTEPAFKKKPPNNRNGIIIGGPIDRAIDTDELAHDMKYPKINCRKNIWLLLICLIKRHFQLSYQMT